MRDAQVVRQSLLEGVGVAAMGEPELQRRVDKHHEFIIIEHSAAVLDPALTRQEGWRIPPPSAVVVAYERKYAAAELLGAHAHADPASPAAHEQPAPAADPS